MWRHLCPRVNFFRFAVAENKFFKGLLNNFTKSRHSSSVVSFTISNNLFHFTIAPSTICDHHHKQNFKNSLFHFLLVFSSDKNTKRRITQLHSSPIAFQFPITSLHDWFIALPFSNLKQKQKTV